MSQLLAWKNEKMYISDFYFGNFETEIVAKHIERFSKIIKLEMVSYDRKIMCLHYKHGQMKKMYISDLSFLKLCEVNKVISYLSRIVILHAVTAS